MENNPLFDRTVSLLSRVLDLRARNHKIIVSNIAHADTPDYKEFRMHVDEALQQQTGTGSTLRLTLTALAIRSQTMTSSPPDSDRFPTGDGNPRECSGC